MPEKFSGGRYKISISRKRSSKLLLDGCGGKYNFGNNVGPRTISLNHMIPKVKLRVIILN
jgi:hypothetical protein